MRVREWYGYHFPEMVRLVNDNYQYCQLIGLIKMRKNLTNPSDELVESIEKVVMDTAKTQAICDCARASMGMDISEFDLINIEIFAKKVISLADYRKKLQQYLSDKMSNVAPSLAALIGDVVGARLISHAGSLTKLAKVKKVDLSCFIHFFSIPPLLSKFSVLRRLFSEPSKQREILPSTVFFSTLPLLVEPLPKTRVKSTSLNESLTWFRSNFPIPCQQMFHCVSY